MVEECGFQFTAVLLLGAALSFPCASLHLCVLELSFFLAKRHLMALSRSEGALKYYQRVRFIVSYCQLSMMQIASLFMHNMFTYYLPSRAAVLQKRMSMW